MRVACGCTRREFVRLTLGTSVGALAGLAGGLPGVGLQEGTRASRARRLVLLWMAGAPSQLDTFDLKPGAPTGGPFREIETAVPGIRICEHLPQVAQEMRRLSLVRTVHSSDPNHETATYFLHTGYRKAPDTMHPHFASVLVKELGSAADLPGCVAIGGNPPAGSGYLAPETGPVVFDKLSDPTEDVMLAKGITPERLEERWKLLREFEGPFLGSHDDAALEARSRAYERAYRVLTSRRVKAFDVQEEPEKVRRRYGDTPLGRACLMARRLLEAEVRCVEVMFGDWDTHADNFNGHRKLMADLDPACAALVGELAERGLLDETLVVWMGEFGRTPAVNGAEGRDHFTRAWTVMLGGGGVAGGRVVGRTDETGREILERPVSVADLFATVYSCFGIDARKEHLTQAKRPLKILEGGEPVRELF